MFLKRQERRISIIGGLILAGLTLAAGISVFVVMQRQAESLLSQKIQSLLQSNERLFQSEIELSLNNTRSAAKRPFVIQNMQLLASKSDDPSGLAGLQSISKSFVPSVFTGFSFYDVRGHEVVRAGDFSQKHDLRVPLKSNIRAALLWDGGFILQASADVLDQQGLRIGMLMTEAKLSSITEAFADIASIGKTGEFIVCAPVADDEKKMDCFMNRLFGNDFKRRARAVEGRPFPMNYALNGETGILFMTDYRGEQAAAAHTPVGQLGLGMVMKIDRAELFQPVIEQLKFIALVLAALVLTGILLLHVLVRPLVRKLVDSERAARDANTRLGAMQADLSHFKNTLDQTLEAVYIFDPDTLRFTYVNEGAKRQTGYSQTELMQMTPVDIKKDVTLEQTRQRLQPLMAGVLPSLTFESVHSHKDGHDIPVEIFLQLVRLEGQAPRFVSMVTDITERKQAQKEILQINAELEERVRQRTAQLQTANQELEAYSYSVSHDLRAPLNTIDGFSKLLGKEMGASAATERGQHYLARIRAGVVQMGALIAALLALAQISRTSLRRESVDLSALSETVLNAYREREPGRAVQLAIQPGLVVQGDPGLLRQVLENLLGNAWKYSRKQPQTQISLRREMGSDGAWVYAVRDNGAGFDMAYADKLFGVFQRLHTASEFEGTGIGLATVHKIITRHGGRIWAESAPGQGATFYFTLGA